MHLEIVGILARRVKTLAKLSSTRATYLLPGIFSRGLGELEHDLAEKSGNTNGTLSNKKLNGSALAPNGISKSHLTKKAMNDIEAHPELSDDELASKHHVIQHTVRQYRSELADVYLHTNEWRTVTDGAIGQLFGLKAHVIARIRVTNGYFRKVGSNVPNTTVGSYLEKLGGKATIEEALTEGGKTIVDIFREAGLNSLSRERERQIIGEVGCTGDRSKRTALWYARKMLREDQDELAQELADWEKFRKLLAHAGGISALGRQIGVDPQSLRAFVDKFFVHLSKADKHLLKSHREMVSFPCDGPRCPKVIFLAKWQVDYEKKRRPNKTLHFCSKICQGRYLGKHLRGRKRAH